MGTSTEPKKPSFRPYELDWSSLRRNVPDWFRDAKFGLFFHWGPYSVPAFENEWYSRNMYSKGLSQHEHHLATYGPLSEFGYKDFLPLWKADRFDAEEWADLIVSAGGRYAGPVTEHADNFSLWPSKVNPINAMNYGPKRDVVGEMQKAITERGLKFAATFHHHWLWGWFMSSDPDADVYDPANEVFYGPALPLETNRYIPWRMPDASFSRVWAEKVREVVEQYDPDLVYFDGRAAIIEERVRMEMMRHCYVEASGKPDRIISYKQSDFPEGTGILDIECGRFSELKPFAWQTDDRLEDRRTWCHVQEPRYKSATAIIHQLCDVVSKNGNLLLNVGPKADGSFDDAAVKVLHEVGRWLATYGEAIYGTRPYHVYGESREDAGDTSFDVAQIEAQTKTGIVKSYTETRLHSQDIRFTSRDDTLYVIFPGSRFESSSGEPAVRIELLGERTTPQPMQIQEVQLLGTDAKVEWERDAEALTLRTKARMPSPHANVVKIVTRS